MPTGRVKVFFADRKYGFVTTSNGAEVYVAAAEVAGGELHPGDEVEFEVKDSDNGRPVATGVTVTKAAPADSPVGRTLAPPPSWDDLEEQERQRRMARRRRR